MSNIKYLFQLETTSYSVFSIQLRFSQSFFQRINEIFSQIEVMLRKKRISKIVAKLVTDEDLNHFRIHCTIIGYDIN